MEDIIDMGSKNKPFDDINFITIGKNNIKTGILSLEQLENIYYELGISYSDIDACKNSTKTKKNTVSAYDEYYFGIIEILPDNNKTKHGCKTSFFIKKDLFLITKISGDSSYIESAFDKMIKYSDNNGNNISLDRLVYTFLCEIVFSQDTTFQSYEDVIEGLDKSLQSTPAKNINDRISQIRHKLLVLHHYYLHLVNMGETLHGNENGVFGNDIPRFLGLFTSRTMRITERIQLLRDAATQVRETYQSQLDFSLNKTMQLFTVVTTVFLPLTLITSWYGMNFENMPELKMPMAYPILFVVCICVVIICFWIFKKKKYI